MLTAGKIGGLGPGAGCDGPVAKIARDLKMSQAGECPITLVDFKAGFEDSARGAVTSLDWAVVVVDPTTAAIQMAASLKNMVDQIKAGGLPATKHLGTPELVEWANRIFREATVKDVLVAYYRHFKTCLCSSAQSAASVDTNDAPNPAMTVLTMASALPNSR